MPETIDGVVYETTPVIPASTNTPAGGARPFPSGGSPGKAIWQLLKRYAQELDKFESTVIRTLTDRVVAAEKAVSATAPQRRQCTLYTQVTAQGSEAVTRVLWVPDPHRGDPGNPATAANGIALSNGVFTIGATGLHLITSYIRTQTDVTVFIRVNGQLRPAIYDPNGYGKFINIVLALTAGDAVDMAIYRGGSATHLIPINQPFSASARNNITTVQTATNSPAGNNYFTNDWPYFDITRLGG